jgi:hypothetical protein
VWRHLSPKGFISFPAQDRQVSGRLSVLCHWTGISEVPKDHLDGLISSCFVSTCQGLTHRHAHKENEKDLVWQLSDSLWESRQPVIPHWASLNGVSRDLVNGLAALISASFSRAWVTPVVWCITPHNSSSCWHRFSAIQSQLYLSSITRWKWQK